MKCKKKKDFVGTNKKKNYRNENKYFCSKEKQKHVIYRDEKYIWPLN